MSNSKISALTSATTPLAGTEVLPVVQSSATVQVTVANLTAGRAVAARNIVLSNAGGSSTGAVQVTASDQGQARIRIQNTNGQPWDLVAGNPGATNQGFGIYDNTAAATRMYFGTTGDVTVNSGNVIQGTAAKGVNFTANTPAAGMTSQLLNWYEQGTSTLGVTFGGNAVGLTVAPGASTLRYTRIGNAVTIAGYLLMTNKGSSTGAMVITGLPFAVASGNSFNCAIGVRFFNITFGAGQMSLTPINGGSTMSCNLDLGVGTATNLTDTNCTNSTGIMFSGVYYVS
jgi:hypothetical protein